MATPAPQPPHPPQPAAPAPGGGGDAVAQEVARAKEIAAKEEQRQQELVKAQAEATAAHYEAWKESGSAMAHKQIDEVEKIMREPGPAKAWVDHEGNRQEPGMVVGDPTRGPSS